MSIIQKHSPRTNSLPFLGWATLSGHVSGVHCGRSLSALRLIDSGVPCMGAGMRRVKSNRVKTWRDAPDLAGAGASRGGQGVGTCLRWQSSQKWVVPQQNHDATEQQNLHFHSMASDP